ncbi:hypothetical protein B0T22DRAFT_534506 [Podospora appendiculata]|uniref:Sexual development protein n=1 Tax=Podospora appendiculata TaxID=314037 RepID=A0AAE0XLN9_9PEZI|nr:hypothetical protein B0T22DRAFT_534506 [Podospora appendiculata]
MQIIATVLATAAALASLTSAAPVVASAPRSYNIPTDDGFPSPSAQQLRTIADLADGTLSNAPAPAKLAPSSLTAFQLIAFNELFEVAFFSSLVHNITTNVPGFQLPSDAKRDELLDILETVLAQEKLHALNAINVLKKFNAFAPTPCQYRFPSSTVYEAIALAEKFTALVLGTLQDASQLFAKNGDFGPVRSVASSIGQEGEQEGFYRILLAKKPSEKPFLTTSVAAFAYSALQGFVVPGSCAFSLSSIDLPVFPALSVVSGSAGAAVEPRDQLLSFTADLTGVEAAKKFVGLTNGQGLWVTYFSGQLLPISVPVVNVRWAGAVVSFDAAFPFAANVMQGLSVAALTTAGSFAAPGDVVGATLAAPGLIQVDDRTKAWDAI